MYQEEQLYNQVWVNKSEITQRQTIKLISRLNPEHYAHWPPREHKREIDTTLG